MRTTALACGVLATWLTLATASSCPAAGDGSCTYLRTVNKVLWKWSLEAACSSAGGYSYHDSGRMHEFKLNVCANVSSICAPGWPLYTSHGVLIQNWTADPQPCSATCIDADTGEPVCCTGQCAVLAADTPTFQLLDEANPATGGVRLVYPPQSYNLEDPYPCPTSPLGLPALHSLTLTIVCDPEAGPGLAGLVIKEADGAECAYNATASSSVACGVKA